MQNELFTLGKLYVSDFLKDGEQPAQEPVELKMIMDGGFVRLADSAPPGSMYGEKYWYRSGINKTMKFELKHIVDSIFSSIRLNAGDIWLDIACNDGTLLSFVPDVFNRIGVDPANDSFKEQSSKHADLIIQDYFSAGALNGIKAKVITSIAMFYDLEKPEEFIKDIDKVLDKDGLWVMQLSYTPLMIEQVAFDNICHEHIYYYSLTNLKELLERNGFKIVDCQLNSVNGGSFRVYIMKQEGDVKKFSTAPNRDVCQMRIKSLLAYEKQIGANGTDIWAEFFDKIEKLKNTTVDFIRVEKSKGKTIMGYGASTKGNTLLQYFGLDYTLIDAIADRSPQKHGLRTVGTDIPIISEEEMRARHPDYLLILPWHFIDEFKDRESNYLRSGGKFIVPCPIFEIV